MPNKKKIIAINYSIFFSLTLFLIMLLPTHSFASSAACSSWEGAIVISEDGKYLGRIENKYATDPIFNKYGTYGNPYASDSVFNKYGNYGSQYAANSAFNPYTSTPPKVYKNKSLIGRLSTNKYVSGAIDPLTLGVACFDYEP